MYEYEPLGDADNELRLAAVQPGAFDEPIRITFRNRCLSRALLSDDPENVADFKVR